MTDETGTIGYGTAFRNWSENNQWENAEGVDISPDEIVEAVREAMSTYGVTEEEFNDNAPLYLTEIRIVRRITWEDVKHD